MELPRPTPTPAWPHDFLDRIGLADLVARAGLPAHRDPGRHRPRPADARSRRPTSASPPRPASPPASSTPTPAPSASSATSPAPEIERNLALIGGTSSCLMALAAAPRFAPAIWGPHLGAVLPGLWLSEGGQSASGALLDHLLPPPRPAPPPATPTPASSPASPSSAAPTPDLAPRLHVLPDFHGNRSPLADPHALGVVSGLPLDASFDAPLPALLAHLRRPRPRPARAILDHLAAHGTAADTLHLAGGHARNPLLVELYADATGRPTVEPAAPDAVLLGTAMAAATAAGLHPVPRRRRPRDAAGRPPPHARPRQRRPHRARLAGLPRHAAPPRRARRHPGKARSIVPTARWADS